MSGPPFLLLAVIVTFALRRDYRAWSEWQERRNIGESSTDDARAAAAWRAAFLCGGVALVFYVVMMIDLLTSGPLAHRPRVLSVIFWVVMAGVIGFMVSAHLARKYSAPR